MMHLAARAHAFVNGLFRSSDAAVTRELYDKVAERLAAAGLRDEEGRAQLADTIAKNVLASFERVPPDIDVGVIAGLMLRVLGA